MTTRGRPHKPANERAESFLHIRIPAHKKAGYVKRAQKEGITLAQWVINRLDA